MVYNTSPFYVCGKMPTCVQVIKNKSRKMSEELDAEAVAALRKKRQFKKFTFRGLELEKIMDLSKEELLKVVHAR